MEGGARVREGMGSYGQLLCGGTRSAKRAGKI